MPKQSLKLYRPLISNRLTQKFAANLACVYPNGRVTSKRSNLCPNGSKEFYPSIGMKGHSGLDFAAYSGEPVFHAGTYDGILKIEKDFQGGIGVDVVSKNKIELKDGYYGYVKTRYWHLKAPVGWDGKEIKFGEQIGLADNTGASSGDHLHFGLKKCDKYGNAIEKGNGYNGAIDPLPYMTLETDAKTGAQYLNVPPPPLTPQEIKEIRSQLTAAQKLLNLLLELKRLIK